MQVYGPTSVHGPQAITAPHTQRVNSPAGSYGSTAGVRDDVQFSDTAQILSRVHELPEMRFERVAQIREAIASGTYLNGDKLDVALDRLLDEIG